MESTISFNTKFGWISATEINNKITKIQFGKKKCPRNKSKILKNLKKKIDMFIKKKSNKLDISILLNGNNAQKEIWKELKKIRKGKVKTYAAIAKKFKTSPRYIGRVCSENRHLLVVPCHRVIRSDKTLGGFSAPGGTKLKRKLLEFEGVFI